jgi:peptide/nickel transport system permease protein
MLGFIIRRLLQGVLILIIVTFMVFLVMRLLPGDPLMLFVGNLETGGFSNEQIESLRHEFGLDKPLLVQYFDWIGGVLHGDFGKSIFYREKVGALLAQRLPVTAYLGAIAFIIAGVLGIFFGVVCAWKRGKWPDTVFTLLANVGITIPSFWVGILLIYLLGLQLGWLPIYGYTSPFKDFWMSTRQAIMPVFCLSLFSIASLTRQTRSSMLEVIQQDYIRTAWAKGLRERVIVMKHAIKNALIPVITVLGMHVGFIFGGSVLVETVFNIPGIGRLMTEAVFGQDYQVIQACVLLIAAAVVFSNLLVDISYLWIDPRIKYD